MPPLQMNRSFLEGRLQGLRAQQTQRAIARFGIAQESRANRNTGPRRSPTAGLGERGYRDALNQDAEAAEIEAMLNGEQMHTSAAYPVPGMRSTRPGIGSLSLAGGGGGDDIVRQNAQLQNDLLEQARRQGVMDIEDRIRGRETEAINGMKRRYMDPAEQVFSGRADAFARKAGDIERGETMRNARTEAEAFTDPTVAGARRTAVDEEERLLTARYGREADAAAKVRAAEIAAQGRVNAANTTGRAGLEKAALQGLLKSREISNMMGGDPAKMKELEDLLMRYTQQPEAETLIGEVDNPSLEAMIAGAQAEGRDDGPSGQLLSQWWDRMTPAQQARVRQALGGR